ncbi:methane monooxygenase PmoA-like [Actinoplanes lutulentus]|uniref:Methane monooxygenase PmoA-like n=1 Tax=Actinoplanes lutulentus TaxID=1287878 RepID=A0A327ZAN3_9ACTN|nr:methane monooxygenase PmoA-like [Actinoplanes lutulentus]
MARYVWDPHLPPTVSPRPYLHPVTTLGGTTVTGFMPDDHVHHLGASIAVPALNDANFWGGRTYVTGHGSLALDNHGRQRHAGWLHRSADRLVQELEWLDRDGQPVALERRSLAVRPIDGTAWLLRVEFSLRSATGGSLTIDSPAARGRTGAGYGGFFWRAPAGLTRVRAYGEGSHGDVHGSRDPWVVLSGSQPGAADWTLVFLTDAISADPWFVRFDDYAGVCSALAWDQQRVVPADGVLTRQLSVLVADGSPTDQVLTAARQAHR